MKSLIIILTICNLAASQTVKIQPLRNLSPSGADYRLIVDAVIGWNKSQVPDNPILLPPPVPGVTESPAMVRARDYQARGLSLSKPKEILTPRHAKPAVSEDDLMARLKKGETFLIELGVYEGPCRECSGAGKVRIVNGDERTKDGKKPCEKCNGKGQIKVPQQVLVKW